MLKLGALRDFATVYWNGEEIGRTGPGTPAGNGERWTYRVPAARVRGSSATLAVRVFSPFGQARLQAGISGSNFLLTADPLNTVYLAGAWQARTEYALPAADASIRPWPVPPPAPPELKSIPGVLYLGHVYPVLGYGARGAIWYQGEGNRERAFAYRTTFPRLIADWRKHWGADWPFYFCQLPNFDPKAAEPGDSTWAELREAQALTAATVPGTAMAVLIDLGEEGDLHPRNKRDVGERLARVALARGYGKDLPWSAATFASAERQGAAMRIRFHSTYGRLTVRPLPETYAPRSTQPAVVPLRRRAPGGSIEGFAICGRDRRWFWAEAHVDDETVIVSAPEVPEPVDVRYGWADNPTCHLYNGADLPVAPFRTDDFRLTTQPIKTGTSP